MARRAALLAFALLVPACGSGGSSGGSSGAAPDPAPPPASSGRRMKARDVNLYMVYYGAWDDAKIRVARQYHLVIVHPTAGRVTREQVAAIQRGVDPADPSDDVLVLGYVSVGEDARTHYASDAQMAADPRFAGDRTGPRVDPRGPNADGAPAAGIDPLGRPSPGGSGYASWYLDDNDVDRTGVGDGRPDRNGIFGACFVNAGDPKWFDVLQEMTLDGADGVASIREILTTTVGRGLGCDGLFLDTLDTAAPNAFTGPWSVNQSEFEWTAPGFSSIVARLRETYPGHLLLQNRGLFFFDPRHPHYGVTTRGLLDFVFFESYRLDNTDADNPHPYFYPDNQYNIAPKIMAEANRPDGFRVLSLGYAEGPVHLMSQDTLVGRSVLGFDSLLEDIRATQERTGFRHYLSDLELEVFNTFVRDHARWTDTAPPAWTSTFNVNESPQGVPEPPTPRVGVQAVEAGPASLTVRWDVALDMNRVRYALYYQTRPFDFSADPLLSGATRVVLTPGMGRGYAHAPGVYPYEGTVTGLIPGRTYYLVLRAFDESPAANEEPNTAVRTGVPR